MTSDAAETGGAQPRDLTAARAALVRQRLAGRRGGRRPAISPADRTGPLPLSFGQERLWFLNQLTPDSPEYQVPVVLRVRGPLDLATLSRAYQRVLTRHEILRTRYQLRDARPAQVIDEPPAGDIPLSDLSGRPDDERERDAAQLARQEVSTPFDLGLAHPIRIRAIRMAADEHILTITLHHIASDGSSLNILVRELFDGYDAAVSGRTPALPALSVQYADYAVWQRDRLAGDRLDRQLGYWRDQLAGLTPLELHTDRPRAAVRDWVGDRIPFTVSAAVADRLRELAKQRDGTLFVVTLTAFQVLLSRYTGQRDIAVGTAATARGRAELQDLIGFFLDTVVLRARWEGDPPFRTLLDDNRQAVRDAIAHAEAPVQLLVDTLDKNRDLSRTPLFQVMFDVVQAPPADWRVGDLEVAPLDAAGAIAKHDMRLELAEMPDGSLRGTVEYPTALFDAATVERFAGHYVRLLESVAGDPLQRLSELELVGTEQRSRLLADGTGPHGRPRPWQTVPAAVARWAARTPEADAVVTGHARLSYAELDARADQIASLLRRKGVRHESVVAVCLERGVDLLSVLLGVWRAGGAYLPLDPGDPPDRLEYVVRDSRAAVLVTESRHLDRLPATGDLRVVLLDVDRQAIDAEPRVDPRQLVDPDNVAYLIYTSGSAGRPKGVLVTHGGLMNYLWWAAESYTTADGGGAPLFSSVAFDLVVTALYAPLLVGQPVHLLPADLDVTELGSALVSARERAGRFSFVKLTPGHLELLSRQLSSEQAARLADHLVVGGEAFTRRLAVRWWELAGERGAVPVNEYGPTESTVGIVTHPVRRTPPSGPELLPVGRPIPKTTAYVLDDNLRPVPAGVLGELYVGGAQLARGYQGQPAATAERFVPDPYGSPGSRLYRTGDLARVRPDGDIEFVGRADDQVKIRGYRVETAEIVAALRRHPDVQDAAVTVWESGPASRTLVGYIVPVDGAVDVPVDGAVPPAERLRTFLERTLPAYMIPAFFLPIPAIPLTANGKTDYRALPEPDRDTLQPQTAPVPPHSPLEQRLAAVFLEMLGLDRVGVHDDFFDLGGDSVSAVGVVGALRDEGLDVTVQEVFEYSTVAELAEQLAGRPELTQATSRMVPFQMIPVEDRAKIPAGIEDAYPLSMLQTGMIYEMLSGGAVNYYHNATTYTIRDDQPFFLPAFKEAARLLVQRQEMLRTGFDMVTYSTPLQLVHDAAELPVGAQDLRQLSPHDRDRAVRAYMAEERTRLFDFTRPPLLRLFAHVTSDTGWRLTITEFHPILEGWGYHLILMDLLTWYGRLRDGLRAPDHEPLPVRYADFIAAEQASLASAVDRGYWQRVIEEWPKFSPPAAWATGGEQPSEPFLLQVMFVDILDDLRALAKAAEVPFKSVLHAAHLKVISMLTPEQEFFTGQVCDTRPEIAGADRLAGLFLNTVPFPFRLKAKTWRELVRDVFDQEVEMWPHRRYPMLAMQREFGDERRLVESLFNFLDFHSVDTELVDFAASIDDSPNEFRMAATAFAQGLLTLRFHADAVSRRNADRLAAMYRMVLKAMAADPDGDARATYLPADEYRAVVAEWNDTAEDFAPATLAELFQQQADATPDAVAVTTTDGQQITYRQLDRRADQLAHHLHRLGVGPEVFVGLCLEHGVELLVGLLGIVKAGGAYVPLDPGQPAGRLAFILRDVDAAVVITEDRLRGKLAAAGRRLLCLDQNWPPVAGLPDDRPPPSARPDNLVYAMYTSGSAGTPKGVLVTHDGLLNYLRWARDHYPLGGVSSTVSIGSIAADLSVPNYLLPLVSGGSVTVLPAGEELAALSTLLTQGGDIGLLKVTPAHLDLIRGVLPAGATVESVRTVVLGGEQLPGASVAAWRQLAPRSRVINEYGPTETVVGCAVFEAPDDLDPASPVPIGRPIANTRLYVLDRNMRPVPVGVVGELYIGGAGVARGYLNDPAGTAAAFLPDPYSPVPGARCYRSGDLARFRPDGALEFVGRVDDQINFRGHRIEPGEIEARLRAHPDVSEAVVVARGDTGEPRLVGYVVGEQGRTPQVGALREFLGRFLDGPMVPGAFVSVGALPRNRAGKVDRGALPEPDRARPDLDVGYVAARSDTESVLAETWAKVLGVDRIGVHDDLLDLGADSLMGLRVATALADLGYEISPMDAIDHPTVAELARHLRDG